MSPEEKAREDLMILGLKQAVENGYSIATPGSSDAIRATFPDYFATPGEVSCVTTNDELETDDYPMVSRAVDGFWVNAWVWTARGWTAREEDPEEDND